MKVLEEANSDEVKPALGTTCSAFVKVKSRRNMNVAKDAIIDGMGDIFETLTPVSDVKSSGAAYEALDRLIRAGGMGLSSTAWYENELRQLAGRFDELDKKAKRTAKPMMRR